MRSNPKTFLMYCGITILIMAALIVSFNVLVDPYLFFGSPRVERWNAGKPGMRNQSHLIKAYEVLRTHPNTVILGSSGMAIGIDARSPLWPTTTRPVYNLALGGASLFMVRRYLQHILSAQHLRAAILGVDFREFLGPSDSSAQDYESRLKANRDGSTNTGANRQRTKDLLYSTLSLQATTESINTVFNNISGESARIESGNMDSMDSNDFPALTSEFGSFPLMVRADLSYARLYHDAELDTRGWSEIQEIMTLCQINRVSLTIILEPVHADELEMAFLSGKWPAIESWKRHLVQIVATTNKNGAGPKTELWDFFEYDKYSTEPVLDSHTSLHWFYTLSHYNHALGDAVLRRLLGAGDPTFGARLTPENIDDHLAQVRKQRDLYRIRQPQDASRIRKLYDEVN